jgi:hypothetical protein
MALRRQFLSSRQIRGLSCPTGLTEREKKLFRIPYLEAGVSYFGLAEVVPSGRRQFLSQWLPAFITKNSDAPSLRDFAFRLRDELNKIVPPQILRHNPSGFHICGYNGAGFPEFWFLRNIGGMDGFAYKDFEPRYGEPTSDFLDRDAKTLGWDGIHPESVQNKVQIYRNGDVRAHVSGWERLDQMLVEMLQYPDFKLPMSADGWAKCTG